MTSRPQQIIIKIISEVDCLTTNEKVPHSTAFALLFLPFSFLPLSDSASDIFSPYLLQAVISSTGLNECYIVEGDKT